MGKLRKRSPELVKMAVDMYEKGISGNDIAKKLNVSPPTAYLMLKEGGADVPDRHSPKTVRQLVRGEDAEKVIADYKLGMSWKALKEKYSFGQHSMKEAVKRNGVKLRDHGGQRRRIYKHEEEEIVRLYVEEGFSQMQIGAKLKCQQTVVSRILISNGINYKEKLKGEKHHSWEGGRCRHPSGYWVVKDYSFPEMTPRSGYVLEHRLEMAKYLGRALTKYEQVHHIDGNKENNNIENLQLVIGAHGNGGVYCCADCGSKKIKPVEL